MKNRCFKPVIHSGTVGFPTKANESKETKMKKSRHIKNREAGFTLVEIAIVMVIIGLLIGGVFTGRAMIQNARVKRLVSDIDGMRAAVLAFQDKFGMLPGDESDANAPTGDSHNGNNNGQLNETDGWEIEDMRLAGILPGSGTSLPSNAFNGTIRVDWVNMSGNNNYIVVTNIPGEIAQEIDSKYDDGVRTTGEIRGSANYTAGTTVDLGWVL
jgi:prepilin-type N-terminal cleavage/methylation domain-containing protein